MEAVCGWVWIFSGIAQSAKSRKIHKSTKNTVKCGRNLIKYMSVQHIFILLAINIPKLPGIGYVAKKLGTSHDVKGFAIGSFLEHSVVERSNDDLC